MFQWIQVILSRCSCCKQFPCSVLIASLRLTFWCMSGWALSTLPFTHQLWALSSTSPEVPWYRICRISVVAFQNAIFHGSRVSPLGFLEVALPMGEAKQSLGPKTGVRWVGPSEKPCPAGNFWSWRPCPLSSLVPEWEVLPHRTGKSGTHGMAFGKSWNSQTTTCFFSKGSCWHWAFDKKNPVRMTQCWLCF